MIVSLAGGPAAGKSFFATLLLRNPPPGFERVEVIQFPQSGFFSKSIEARFVRGDQNVRPPADAHDRFGFFAALCKEKRHEYRRAASVHKKSTDLVVIEEAWMVSAAHTLAAIAPPSYWPRVLPRKSGRPPVLTLLLDSSTATRRHRLQGRALDKSRIDEALRIHGWATLLTHSFASWYEVVDATGPLGDLHTILRPQPDRPNNSRVR